jgi:hypothetical protein
MKRIGLFIFSSIGFLLILQQCSISFPNLEAEKLPSPEYPDLKQYFDAAYVAQESFEDKGGSTPIANRKPVRMIKDIIGDKDLIWAGKEVPSPMWPTPPVFYVDENTGGAKPTGYIFLHNVTDTYWESKLFTAIPQPYDVYVVLRDVEAVNFEAYFSRAFGLKEFGDRLQLILVSGNANKQILMDAPTKLPFNKISIVRLRYDGANTKVWLNNVQVPPNTVDVGDIKINLIAYGTNSHVAQHDFFGMWAKFGTLTPAEHEIVYKTLADFYNPGNFPTKPLADKIKAVWDRNTKSWSAQYTYVGENPEDLTKTEFQWGYQDLSKDLDTSTLFPGDKAKGKTLVRSDFPGEIPLPGQANVSQQKGVRVFVIVKVYDNKGNSWRHLVRSGFTVDNEP